MENIKFLCKCLGGSHAYGLNTPSSDEDLRGVFLHIEPDKILGLNKADHYTHQEGKTDVSYFELRHFLNLLRKSITGAIELLYNDNWLEITPEFKEIQKHKEQLVDTQKLFKCLMGYLQGEKRLMRGERTGRLGSKRKNEIEKLGFSSKCLINSIRLCYVGATFFTLRQYPVNIAEFGPWLAAILMEIKLHPEDYSLERANKMVEIWETHLKKCFDDRNTQNDLFFNEKLANQLVLDLYYPILKGIKEKIV